MINNTTNFDNNSNNISAEELAYFENFSATCTPEEDYAPCEDNSPEDFAGADEYYNSAESYGQPSREELEAEANEFIELCEADEAMLHSVWLESLEDTKECTPCEDNSPECFQGEKDLAESSTDVRNEWLAEEAIGACCDIEYREVIVENAQVTSAMGEVWITKPAVTKLVVVEKTESFDCDLLPF